MKVCILTERMRLGFGVDLVVDEQARRLVELGFEVVVIAIHSDFEQPPRKYRLFVINRVLHVRDYGSRDWMNRVISVADVEDADVYILQTPPFYDWARWLPRPVILIEYGAPPGYFFDAHVGDPIDANAHSRLNNLYSELLPCDAIMSISESIHEWLPRLAQKFSSVIHLGGDHYPRVSPDEARSLRTELGVGEDDCLILWVGRMQLENDEQPYKGFQALLKLLPLLERNVPRVKFALLGRVSSEDAAKLRKRGLLVLANQPGHEMGRAYAAADLLVNLSEWEGFNLALLEAQYQGTPVVTYDLGPHPEIVVHGETGLLSKTPAELFKAVVTVATDRPLRARLGANAEMFAREFTWQRNVEKLVQLVEASTAMRMAGADIRELRRRAAANAVPKPMLQPRFAFAKPDPQRRPVLDPSSWFKLYEEALIRQAYRVLLGREAEIEAVRGWAEKLRNNLSRRDLLRQIHFSDEGRHRPLHDAALRGIIHGGDVDGRDASRVQQARPEASGADSKIVDQHLELSEAEQQSLQTARHVVDGAIQRIAQDISKLQASIARIAITSDITSLSVGADQRGLKRFGSNEPSAGAPLLIESSHVVLLAYDVVLDVEATERLKNVIRAKPSDIVFGDEWECASGPSGRRLRVLGPFLHGAFLLRPTLGGAVAVRLDLLDRLGLAQNTVLTTVVLLQLVAEAHTVTYLPAALCERMSEDRASIRSNFEELLRPYHARMGRFAAPVGGDVDPSNVRRPASVDWKAAIVVTTRDNTSTNEASLTALRAITPMERCHVILAGWPDAADLGKKSRLASNTLKQSAPTFGSIVNAAVRKAPADCNIIVVMDVGAQPESADWLERLAISAMDLNIGVVAPITLYPDRRIRHAGLAAGHDRELAYDFQFHFFDDPTWGGIRVELDLPRAVSAVGNHCMVFRRSVFEDIGGLDENIGEELVDVDLCVRMKALMLNIIVDGRVILVQPDPAPRRGRILPELDRQILGSKYAAFACASAERPADRLGAASSQTITVSLPPIYER